MTTFVFADNAQTTLAAAASSAAPTITLASAANFPGSIPSGSVLAVTLNDAATRSIFEICYATAISGTSVTVTRAQEGTSAQSWNVGDIVYCSVTAGMLGNYAQGKVSGGQCVLSYNSGTSMTLLPNNGDGAIINGAQYQIPAAGVSAANTSVLVNGSSGSLAANTTYYVSLYNNGGTLALAFWVFGTYGHASDNSSANIGVEVIQTVSGGALNSSHSLVAMIQTDGSSHFQSAHGVGFINWFNRRNIALVVGIGSFANSNSSLLELSSSLRLTFLTWGDEALQNIAEGFFSTNVANNLSELQSAIDGVLNGSLVGAYMFATAAQVTLNSSYNASLADGQHVSSPYFSTGAGGISASFNQMYNRILMRG